MELVTGQLQLVVNVGPDVRQAPELCFARVNTHEGIDGAVDRPRGRGVAVDVRGQNRPVLRLIVLQRDRLLRDVPQVGREQIAEAIDDEESGQSAVDLGFGVGMRVGVIPERSGRMCRWNLDHVVLCGARFDHDEDVVGDTRGRDVQPVKMEVGYLWQFVDQGNFQTFPRAQTQRRPEKGAVVDGANDRVAADIDRLPGDRQRHLEDAVFADKFRGLREIFLLGLHRH
jgi:hypothetical protein